MAHITIPDDPPRDQHVVGVTPQDEFVISFHFFNEDTDIQVFQLKDGIETELTDYTVTGNPGTEGGFEGGIVTLGTPVTSCTITILRAVPYERVTDFPTTGSFNIQALNTQLDQLIAMIQQINEKLRRSLVQNPSTNLLDIIFPIPEGGTVLGWNSDATALENKSAVDATVLVTPYMETVLGQSSARDARTVLDAVGQDEVRPGLKNRLINGCFRIWQRGASHAGVVNAYTADRWQYQRSGSSAVTVAREAGPPTALTITVTTAQTPMPVNNHAFVRQKIEGVHMADFGFGAAGARPLALSFEVWSPKTGLHSVALQNGGATRSYIVGYEVQQAGTWERKILLIPGDTGGTWATDTSAGMLVAWPLAAGSDFHGEAEVWQNGNLFGLDGQVNLLDTNGNVFKLRNVQLEVGPVATPFEMRPIGIELALCQRYYEKSYGMDVVPGTVTTAGAAQHRDQSGQANREQFRTRFAVEKRAVPTVTWYSTVTGVAGNIRNATGNSDAKVSNTLMVGTTSAGFPNSGGGGAGNLWEAHWVADAEI